MAGERKAYSTWDDSFMAMAMIFSTRSKDPVTQVGAVIVTPDHRILSVGYNGTPNGFTDEDMPWGKGDPDRLNTKYPFVVHAERNAVLNFRGYMREFKGATVFVTHFPCCECAKELVQVEVGEVVYLHGDQRDAASELILQRQGVTVRPFEPSPFFEQHFPQLFTSLQVE